MSELTRKKNESSEIMFAMVDSATPANLKSGLTVTDTPYYRDGAGAWTALSISDDSTEIGSTGMYTIEMTAAELNHDLILIKLTAIGAADTIVVVRTTTHDIDDVNIVVPDAAGVAPTAAEIKTEIEQAGSSIASILEDTGDLQSNQGAWATAIGFSPPNEYDTVIAALQTDLDNPDQYKAIGFSTHSAADVKTAIEATGSSIASILADTNEIQTDWVDGGRLDLLLDAIPTTAMRGTDNAALASGVDITKIHGAALTETIDGYLAAAFTKLFDVATPLLTVSEVMRGTDGANTTTPATVTAIREEMDANSGKMAPSQNIADYKADVSNLDAAVSSRNATTPPTVAAIRTEMEGAGYSLDLIKADTNELQTDWHDAGRLDALLDLCYTGTPPTVIQIRTEMDDHSTKMAPSQDLAAYKATGFSVPNEYDDAIAALQSDLDNPSQYMATGFSTHSAADIWAVGTRALTDKTGFALSDVGANLILKDSLFALAIADAIWDEILTGATHNIATSAGKRVRQIGAYAIHDGTAQAGAATSFTLAATATGGDGVYNRNLLVVVGGTGVGQTRTIVDYDDATKVCVVDRDWRVTPDSTSEYQITAADTALVVDHGVAQGATTTTITLRDYASDVDGVYVNNIITIVAGTGVGETRLVKAYNGTTKVATMFGDNWVTTPDTNSVYVMMPYGCACIGNIHSDALALINAECDTALTDYDPPTRAEATTDKNAIITEVDANETKIDTVDTVVDAIKAKTDNLPSGLAKNVAVPKFDVFMVLASDHVIGATGKTVTGTISKDGEAFVALTNPITEVDAGMYTIASGLTQEERNADVSTLKFSADGCDDRIITIISS